MVEKSRWEEREIVCPENPDRCARLLVEWREEAGEPVVRGIQCDNPRLADLDNWDCEWSCWEKIRRDLKR
jgi:hypothetical protein